MMELRDSLIMIPLVFGGGAGVLLGALAVMDNPVASFLSSCLACYGVCAVVVLIAWSVVTVALERDDRPPSRLALGIGVLVPAFPAWGLFHLVHEVIGSSAVIRVSEGVGCFIVFTLGFGLLGQVVEWRDAKKEKKLRLRRWASMGTNSVKPLSKSPGAMQDR